MRDDSNDRSRKLSWPAVHLLVLILVLLAVPTRARAQGGPPLLVDDPDTPGPGYWEVNVASVFENSSSQHRRELPLIDANYGVGERIQLKFEMPWLSAERSGEATHVGGGNALVGVKWRFLGQEWERIAWATYPQLEIPTARAMADEGFAADRVQFILPTEFTLQMGRLEINTEVGRTFVRSGADEWFWGAAAEVELSRTELLAEVHGEGTDTSTTEVIAELGARRKLTQQIVLLGAVGTGVRGPSDERLHLRVYLGLQFNLPHQFNLGTSPDVTPASRRGRR